MTGEQLAGFIRTLLSFAGGFLVSKGVIDEGTLTAIIGGVAVIVAAVWSWWSKAKTPVLPPPPTVA